VPRVDGRVGEAERADHVHRLGGVVADRGVGGGDDLAAAGGHARVFVRLERLEERLLTRHHLLPEVRAQGRDDVVRGVQSALDLLRETHLDVRLEQVRALEDVDAQIAEAEDGLVLAEHLVRELRLERLGGGHVRRRAHEPERHRVVRVAHERVGLLLRSRGRGGGLLGGLRLGCLRRGHGHGGREAGGRAAPHLRLEFTPLSFLRVHRGHAPRRGGQCVFRRSRVTGVARDGCA
jgi:hypothetical protein